MKKRGQATPEVQPTEGIPEKELKQPDPVQFFFAGREYNTARLTEEEREYLRRFPEEVPFQL